MTTLKVDAVVTCNNDDINVRSGVSGQLLVAAGLQLDEKATAEKAAANKAADAKAAAEKAAVAAAAAAAALRREMEAVRAAVEMAAACGRTGVCSRVQRNMIHVQRGRELGAGAGAGVAGARWRRWSNTLVYR